MSLFDLSGKVALITGSTKGIGLAIATHMAEAGAKVVVSSRNQDACDEVAANINANGGDAFPVACNINYKEQLRILVDKTIKHYGKIDILVINAALNPFYGPSQDIPDEAFDKIMNSNIGSAHRLCQLVLPGMAENGGGATIIVSSIAGLKGTDVLGAYGISTRLTLDIQPTYDVRQDVYYGMRWDGLLDNLEEILTAAYSVSVFTMWGGDDVEQVWRKSRIGVDQDPPDQWWGATRNAVSDASLVGGDPAALTAQGGSPGPWLERLPHFRLENTPSNGDEIQTEYFVDRAVGAQALEAVRGLADRIDPHLLITELRTLAADDLWLSGAYGRDTMAIHFTWRNSPEEVAALLPAIEEALAPFDARPHWGKWHRFSRERLAAVHPRIDDARALFDRLDPGARFSNHHLARLGVRSSA
jgi:hypothetical protein